jgi:hypothetical protein
MKTAFDRRGFLQAAGLAAASSLAAGVRAGARPTEGMAHPRPRLLTGCCAYSYGKYLETGKMTMEDFILKAVELEVVGVDMTAYWLKSKEPASEKPCLGLTSPSSKNRSKRKRLRFILYFFLDNRIPLN